MAPDLRYLAPLRVRDSHDKIPARGGVRVSKNEEAGLGLVEV